MACFKCLLIDLRDEFIAGFNRLNNAAVFLIYVELLTIFFFSPVQDGGFFVMVEMNMILLPNAVFFPYFSEVAIFYSTVLSFVHLFLFAFLVTPAEFADQFSAVTGSQVRIDQGAFKAIIGTIFVIFVFIKVQVNQKAAAATAEREALKTEKMIKEFDVLHSV